MEIAGLETPTQVFSCEICKTFKNTYFEEHLQTTALILYDDSYSNNITNTLIFKTK